VTRWIGLAIAATVHHRRPSGLRSGRQAAPGTIVAADFRVENRVDGTPRVTIKPGETVTFSDLSGASFTTHVHRADPTPTPTVVVSPAAPPQPTVCGADHGNPAVRSGLHRDDEGQPAARVPARGDSPDDADQRALERPWLEGMSSLRRSLPWVAVAARQGQRGVSRRSRCARVSSCLG
jgi:hypothetical protein